MICFLCLDETGEMLPIFGFDGNVHNSISHIIEKYLDIKPPLPVENKFYEICSQCWQKLTDFHEYYQNIKSHEEQRLKMVELNETKNFIEIKEEIPYISPSSSVADEYETEDPFLSVLDKECLKDNTTPKTMPIKPKKRTNPSKSGKSRKKEENLSIPANEIKSEELENVTNSKNNETKRRKGYILLEENEELIRKHIQMLCQICPHTCCEFQDLVKHFKEEHPDVKPHVKCCERKLDCPSDILQHAYYHENPDYFKCNECGKTFINKSGLRDHYVHNHEPEENLSFACDECPRRFSRKNLLEHHKSKHVPEIERSYYCETCVPRKASATVLWEIFLPLYENDALSIQL
ncbi:uncharacterized protein LOC142238666 isoform X2 [Haematobia irritans]|uniref:uncharacterized protein LOC142238666 isoform X2 n=1 Tax=Haematobia irritans TaxID=7368 RepID=UPI003F501635